MAVVGDDAGMSVAIVRWLAAVALISAASCDRAPAETAPQGDAASPVQSDAKGPGQANAQSKTEAPAPAGGAGIGAKVDELRAEAEAAPVVEAAPVDPTSLTAGGNGLPVLPTGVMATVGGVEIPMSAFREIYDLKVEKYAERGRDVPASADRRYRKSIAERLIYHQALAAHAAALGVEHDPAQLVVQQQAARRGIRDFAKHLERRGETEATLDAMAVATLREEALLKHEGALVVTKADITADYDKIKGNWESPKPRVRASHILVRIGPPPAPRGTATPTPTAAETARWEAEAKRDAEAIHATATAPGADFAALAQLHSTGPSATKGGDVGIFTHDRMASEFSDAAFALAVGQISAPVKTKFGFHIIKLTGKWGPGPLPEDALADQIGERLRQRKLHDGRRALKERVLTGTTIVNHVLPTLGPEPKRGGRPKHDRGK